MIHVYCEKHIKHTDKICGQNAVFWCVKAGGTYSKEGGLSVNVGLIR
jgi:hypothetical protein